MRTITKKDIRHNKKPIQIYFEQDTVLAINQAAKENGIPVAEYIRKTIIKDLNANDKKKSKKQTFKTFDLGGPLNNTEMDSIIYKL